MRSRVRTHPEAGHQADPGAESLPAASRGSEPSRWGGDFKEAAPDSVALRVPRRPLGRVVRACAQRAAEAGGLRAEVGPRLWEWGGAGRPGRPQRRLSPTARDPPAPPPSALTSVAAVAEGRGTVRGRGAGAAGRAGS